MKKAYRFKIVDILVKLTDVTGYDHASQDHDTAFSLAVKELENLIKLEKEN